MAAKVVEPCAIRLNKALAIRGMKQADGLLCTYGMWKRKVPQ